MSTKVTDLSNSEKILNSDIYDLTEFVDNIKKLNIVDGIPDNDTKTQETLLVGMYGYLGYEFTSLLQNTIVVSSELANEAIPTRAKYDRNVITHALSLGINKVAATAATMKVLLLFPERALRNNMVDGKFTFKSSTPIRFGSYEFHTDYDINIYSTELKSSTNGTNKDYVYTAHYDMTTINPISDIDNEYLPPISIFSDSTDNMVMLITVLHQVEYSEIEEKIIGNDDITNKTLSFTFTNQMSHFSVEVTEATADGSEKTISLIPVYDGLYNQEVEKYVYYPYINSNTIRLRFDPNSYQPRTNANVKIKLWTSQGASGNFDYTNDLTVRLTSDDYTNLYMIVKQRAEDGSYGGLDRKSTEELQKIIPKEALSRGSITTLNDLRNYFNSINNETSVLHVFRKEDNILTRIYYTYYLMKDSNYNIIPTNTIPVFIDASKKVNGKMYLESGQPIYYYKKQESRIPIIKNNYIGHNVQSDYYNDNPNYESYTWRLGSFLQSHPSSYKFYLYSNIKFKIFSDNEEDEYRDEWFFGYIYNISKGSIVYSNSQGRENIEFLKLNVKVEDKNHILNDSYDYVNITLKVPMSITVPNLRSFTESAKKFVEPLGDNEYILDAIDPIVQYGFYCKDERYNFDALKLYEGYTIEFSTYGVIGNNWKFGQVLEVVRKNDRIISLTVLVEDKDNNTFNSFTYRVPTKNDVNESLGKKLTENDIMSIKIVSEFIYTNPLSIVLTDDDSPDSSRVSASYYLDNINEERYLDFKCINSKSSLQFITSYVKVFRPSYLSSDRYNYTISFDLIPNIGSVTDEMINRTKVIVVFYRDNIPAVYSIANFLNSDGSTMSYEVKLFTKPFIDETDNNKESNIDTIDDNNRLYIGDKYLSKSGYSLADYKLYQATGDNGKERLTLNNFYLDKNVTMRIYTLYKYNDDVDINESQDELTRQYKEQNTQFSNSGVSLFNTIPRTTVFSEPEIETIEEFKEYTLNDMVLTNVYETHDGINLLYDYSNLMNSYVSMVSASRRESGYIINRVPVIRYFYFNTEEKINTFIKELKRKILYVLDALDPLECTFGLDFKFFNTYGPSNTYRYTDTDGNLSDLINNITLTMTFRAKFYNENSDKESIIPLIKNDIKNRIENMEELSDIHFPNLTTEIESKYSDYLIYFEYVSFNIYDAKHQHIISEENMETLTCVPEFLNIDTSDYTGLHRININVVS